MSRNSEAIRRLPLNNSKNRLILVIGYKNQSVMVPFSIVVFAETSRG